MRIGLGIDVHAFAASESSEKEMAPLSREGSPVLPDEESAASATSPIEESTISSALPDGIGHSRTLDYRPLILGGVHIEHTQSLEGHSDADVLVHAVMDALLGAARLGDIGQHFPPTNPAYKGANSLELLEWVGALITREGWELEDLDCVVVAQAPRLSPYRDEMRANIARALNAAPEQVGIKATTSEYLGFEGREEGISAYAVALLRPRVS